MEVLDTTEGDRDRDRNARADAHRDKAVIPEIDAVRRFEEAINKRDESGIDRQELEPLRKTMSRLGDRSGRDWRTHSRL